jgi:hypothetical protein
MRVFHPNVKESMKRLENRKLENERKKKKKTWPTISSFFVFLIEIDGHP